MQRDTAADLPVAHGHLRGRPSPLVLLRSMLLHGILLRAGPPDPALPAARHRRRRHVRHHAEPGDHVGGEQVLGHRRAHRESDSSVRCDHARPLAEPSDRTEITSRRYLGYSRLAEV